MDTLYITNLAIPGGVGTCRAFLTGKECGLGTGVGEWGEWGKRKALSPQALRVLWGRPSLAPCSQAFFLSPQKLLQM